MVNRIEVNTIHTAQDANILIKEATATGECAVDTETDGLHWSLGSQPFMATFSPDDYTTYACYSPALVRQILTAFQGANVALIFQNATFDLHMLRSWDGCKWYPEGGYVNLNFHDTMHGSRIHYPGVPAGLKDISRQFSIMDDLDVKGPQKVVNDWIDQNTTVSTVAGAKVKTVPTYADVPDELMFPYATQDTLLTIRLHHTYEEERKSYVRPDRIPETVPDIRGVYNAEMACVKVCIEMERRGIPLDDAKLRDEVIKAQAGYAAALSEWSRTPWSGDAILASMQDSKGKPLKIKGIVPASSTALRQLLYGIFEEPVKHRTKQSKTHPDGQPGTDEAALVDCETPNGRIAAKCILALRGWKKYTERLTELDAYLSHDGRVHTSLRADIARTGRFSSTEPALQNLSRPNPDKPWTMARALFRPEAGKEFLLGDFSQIELRIAAHYMRDWEMIHTLATGGDLHRDTAAAMYGLDKSAVTKAQRAMAKILNFSILYGAGTRRVTETLRYGAAGTDPLTIQQVHEAFTLLGVNADKLTDEECFTKLAKTLVDAFHANRPLVRPFLDKASKNARKYGCIYTFFGLRVPIPPITYSSVYGRWVSSDHKAGNAIIQGSAAGLMKATIVRAEKACRAYCEEHKLSMWKDIEILLTIHDELIFQVPIGHAEPLAKWIDKPLSDWPTFDVPIVLEYAKVENGSNWANKKGFELV